MPTHVVAPVADLVGETLVFQRDASRAALAYHCLCPAAGKGAEIVGGIVLIGIGSMFLYQH